jgi:PKD repeat protein
MAQTTISNNKSLLAGRAALRAGNLKVYFTYAPGFPREGQAVQFVDSSTGSPTSWQWNFGDGLTSTARNPVHIFSGSGFRRVTLIAANSVAAKTVTRTVAIMSAKTTEPATLSSLSAAFTYSPSSPLAGQMAQFTDTSSGAPTSWQWNFGDGTSSTAQNPGHSYPAAGFYDVSLTVTRGSESKIMNHTVTVVPGASFDPSFTFSPTAPVAGQAVQFTDTSTGDPSSWLWNFSDGTTSISQSPNHAFNSTGSYNVSLMATNSSGSKSISAIVNVLPASMLTAAFTYSPSSPTLGQTVEFSDTSTGSPTAWLWNFGDGVSSAVQSPSHGYTSAGSYMVSLTIGAGSNSSNASQTLTIEHSDVISAASPAYSDVYTAVARAGSGDTVLVPAGSARWASQLVINKGVKLIGAGIGNTVITSDYPAAYMANPSDPSNFLIVYAPTSPELNEPFRLSGFTFDQNNKCQAILIGNGSTAAINKVRVDHNKIINTSRAFQINGTVYGVADNNEIYDGTIISYGSNATSWNNLIFSFGSADNFYFENNIIYLDDLLHMGGAGGRYACRYNRYVCFGTRGTIFLWDAHGNQPGANNAIMGVEMYENTIEAGTIGIRLLDLRGGMGLCYNNNVISSSWLDNRVREEYLDSILPPASSPISGQPQHISNSFFWGNKKSGVAPANADVAIGDTVDYGGSTGIVPREDREFWREKAVFNGTTGMGVGLLANRPTTGTLGVGYWATDAKILYRWTENNRWEEYYKPYTYPHPLRIEN